MRRRGLTVERTCWTVNSTCWTVKRTGWTVKRIGLTLSNIVEYRLAGEENRLNTVKRTRLT